MEWYEELPDSCPPEDTEYGSNRTFFRITERKPPIDSDFFSQRKLSPHKAFNIDECIARSLSIFSNRNDALNIMKLPKFKNYPYLYKIKLNNNAGVIKKTSSKSHYSWWRSKAFDFTNGIEMIEL